MEYLHNVAASTDTVSAETVKKYAEKRREGLDNGVITWVNNTEQNRGSMAFSRRNIGATVCISIQSMLVKLEG